MLGQIKKVLFGEEVEIIGVASNASEIVTAKNVNPLTNCPEKAWDAIKSKVNKEEVEPLKLDTPIYDNKIRVVCISDTHSKIDKMIYEIPSGDILIHAGDFTNNGATKDIENFSAFLSTLNDKFKYKVVIVGNHELTFDEKCERFKWHSKLFNEEKKQNPRELLKNCIYLEDSHVELFGIKIYGAPWQPEFGDWGFNLPRGQALLDKWNMIPEDTSILITHGPPLGFGDIVRGGYHVGCCELYSTITERVKPKYHIFGHIHEDYGAWTDGTTTFVNASTCSIRMRPENPPFIFDIDLPEGVSKNDF